MKLPLLLYAIILQVDISFMSEQTAAVYTVTDKHINWARWKHTGTTVDENKGTFSKPQIKMLHTDA